MKHLLPVLLTCIAIGGCTNMEPYRTELEPVTKPCKPVVKVPSDCPNGAFYLLAQSPGSKPDYDIPIGIIEFDDQGVLQERPIKDGIMDKIRKQTSKHGTLTVVFAHGWLNNAHHKNPNLAEFQKMLKRIAIDDWEACENSGCKGRKVVGVYMAWRGMSAEVQPFKSLSFWNRKSRAERVGQDGATEVLADLAKIKSVGNSNKKDSKLILIGHSFGGALIYSATQQLLMKDAVFVPGAGKSVHRTTADLVILVNPAFEAARFTPLHEKAAKMKFPDTQSPILAIFTSETDNATKLAFPLGRHLSTLFKKYNPKYPVQSKLDRTAVGHYTGYLTHELNLKDKKARIDSPVDIMCGWEDFREKEFGKEEILKGEELTWDLGSVILKKKDPEEEKSRRMNPYYNIKVDKAIIKDHSAIWESNFMEFIYRFILVQDSKSCDALRLADRFSDNTVTYHSKQKGYDATVYFSPDGTLKRAKDEKQMLGKWKVNHDAHLCIKEKNEESYTCRTIVGDKGMIKNNDDDVVTYKTFIDENSDKN